MSDRKKAKVSARSWIEGMIVIVAIIVSYIGFASISIKWTLVVSSLIFIFLILFLWRTGVRKKRDGSGGR